MGDVMRTDETTGIAEPSGLAQAGELGPNGSTDFTAFDHTDPAIADRVDDMFRTMREQCPVPHTRARGGFAVASTASALKTAVLKGSARVTGLGAAEDVVPGTAVAPLFETDSPEHAGWRILLQASFSSSAATAAEPRARETARDLLDRLAPAGTCDVTVDLASWYPSAVIADVMGIDEDRQARFRHLARVLVVPANDTLEDLFSWLQEEISSRRGSSRQDMFTRLINDTAIRGRALTDEELLRFAVLMVSAAVMTTADAITNVMRVLATNRSLRARVAADLSLVPALVAESIRFDTPVAATGRTLTHDTVLDGTAVSAGTRVLCAWASGARDGVADADSFVIERDRGDSTIAWGWGAHRCLGQRLGEMQLRVLLEEWLTRIPDFELAPGTRPTRTFGTLRGTRDLIVTWPN